jgi:hypothetical protein
VIRSASKQGDDAAKGQCTAARSGPVDEHRRHSLLLSAIFCRSGGERPQPPSPIVGELLGWRIPCSRRLIEIIDVLFPKEPNGVLHREWEKIVSSWLRRVFRRHIVAEVPDELSACLECGAVQCVEGTFRNCRRRLERVAALKALREGIEQESNTTR